MQVIASDLDGVLFSHPAVMVPFLQELQAAGNKVGILTARPKTEQETLIKTCVDLGFTPDFLIDKPDEETASDGAWKAMVCNEADIDILVDDFEQGNHGMLADFFALNQRTLALQAFSYQP